MIGQAQQQGSYQAGLQAGSVEYCHCVGRSGATAAGMPLGRLCTFFSASLLKGYCTALMTTLHVTLLQHRTRLLEGGIQANASILSEGLCTGLKSTKRLFKSDHGMQASAQHLPEGC